MKEFAVLVWSPNNLYVLTNKEKFQWEKVIAPEDRYGLRLHSDYTGRLYLRVIQNRQPFMISVDKGINFEPIPPIPGEGLPLSAFQCKVHTASGIITVIENKKLWAYEVATSQWNLQELPSDIHVRDVSFDRQGGMWYAGSTDSTRIPGENTEASVRHRIEGGVIFLPHSPRLTSIDAIKVINQGGLAELRTIDAEEEPVVATSNCSWILEDNSSFIFIFFPKRTYVKRLKGELICHIDRPKVRTVRVFTYAGSIWNDNGTGLKHYSLVPAIEKALGILNRRILIRGIDTRHEKIIVAVEVTPSGAGDFAQDPEFTAVCISLDGGRSFISANRLAFKNGEEIQDVAWLD